MSTREFSWPVATPRVRGGMPAVPVGNGADGRWRTCAGFWNDRQAVRFKLLLLAVCAVAAALLEAPL